jgi:hypothetical protein
MATERVWWRGGEGVRGEQAKDIESRGVVEE